MSYHGLGVTEEDLHNPNSSWYMGPRCDSGQSAREFLENQLVWTCKSHGAGLPQFLVEAWCLRMLRRARGSEEGEDDQDGRDAAHGLTFAMIGVVRKDGCGAEQLLRQHRPDEQVRPGRCSK